MKVVVRNFLRAVRVIQRHWSSSVQCKRARLQALTVLWDKIEFPFIKVQPIQLSVSFNLFFSVWVIEFLFVVTIPSCFFALVFIIVCFHFSEN